MAGYIGSEPAIESTQTRQQFTVTDASGQTSFPTVGYTSGFVTCHLNGIRILEGVDWNVGSSNGSDIVLATAAALNDILEVTIFSATDLSTSGGGGRYKGERGTVGAAGNAGDIFRVHEKQLDTDVTIAATENALAAGPLAVASGKTLTITTGGNLSIV